MLKKSLNIMEQLNYLKENKNIIIDDLEEAEKILSSLGYINLISPYKHYFHSGKIEGKHIYEGQVTIDDYVKKYNEDKEITMYIRENIYEFEKLVKTQITNVICVEYSECENTEKVKEKIVEKIEQKISQLEEITSSTLDENKLTNKIKYYQELKIKFEDFNQYYLIINKLELGKLITLVNLFDENNFTTELKYFKYNSNTLRIIRNNISHCTFIQIYLNNLDMKFKRNNLKVLKRIELYLINNKEINYNLLENSYIKYNS